MFYWCKVRIWRHSMRGDTTEQLMLSLLSTEAIRDAETRVSSVMAKAMGVGKVQKWIHCCAYWSCYTSIDTICSNFKCPSSKLLTSQYRLSQLFTCYKPSFLDYLKMGVGWAAGGICYLTRPLSSVGVGPGWLPTKPILTLRAALTSIGYPRHLPSERKCWRGSSPLI